MASDSIPEEWRPVEGWPYEVSNLGRLRRSIDSPPSHATRPGRVLSPGPDGTGYKQAMLYRTGGERRRVHVHVLVCTAFHGPRPGPKYEVAHWDGDRTNNELGNLRWATQKENRGTDAIRLGRAQRGTNQKMHKLSDSEVRWIRREYDSGRRRCTDLARLFGVSHSAVSMIIHRKRWAWMD